MLNYRDFKRTNKNFNAIGMFGDEIYAYEVLTGPCGIPGYYQITKQEYDTYNEWKDESSGELGRMYEIINRKPLCSGYTGQTEIVNPDKELTCSKCGYSFLVDYNYPVEMESSRICPRCNAVETAKDRLINEIKMQLKNASLRIENLGSLLTGYYIDPYTKEDMRGYVKTGEKKYYIEACERGKVVITYETENVQLATYIILQHLLRLMEFNRLEDSVKRTMDGTTIIRNKCKVYFDHMDQEYQKWYHRGINICNIDKALLDNK